MTCNYDELDLEMPTPRFDAYFNTQKALRWLMCNTLTQLGKVDPDEALEAELALAQLRDLFRFIEQGMRFDAAHIAPALGRYGLNADALLDDEQATARCVTRLSHLCRALEMAGPAQRGACLVHLYDKLAMLIEDRIPALRRNGLLVGELQARCSGEDIAFMQAAMVAAMDEYQLRHWMYWMMPALHPGERAAMLSLARAQLCPGKLTPIVAMLEDVLPRNAYRRLLEQFDAPAAMPPPPARRAATQLYL